MTVNDVWVVGWNMPGYLPEMEPYECDTPDEAWDRLQDVMNCDGMDMSDIGTPDERGEYGLTLGQYHYWITLDHEDVENEHDYL